MFGVLVPGFRRGEAYEEVEFGQMLCRADVLQQQDNDNFWFGLPIRQEEASGDKGPGPTGRMLWDNKGGSWKLQQQCTIRTVSKLN